MAELFQINWRSSKGWLRVWILAALIWIGYAATQFPVPSRFDRIELANYLLAAEGNAKAQADTLMEAEAVRIARSERVCISGTIEEALSELPAKPVKPRKPKLSYLNAESEPPLLDPLSRLDLYEYEADLRSYQIAVAFRSDAMANATFGFEKAAGVEPTHQLKLWCDSIGDRNKKVAKWAARVVVPPLIVPALLVAFLMAASGLARWLLAGFREP
ncbi:hypothetical protein [Pseudoblastomonas halimionae]|uniref:Uncharacterized protein n=1 Tax=Alteriqipengyuania halimionae TaxID=1926630 RepID=A0A6I4U8U4_9SPHN|nr:hypothetical protein [Alteriqipengyuania halimionae]MXP10761.1 hypothetical protein [Alteriqipengyuania halimionae]